MASRSTDKIKLTSPPSWWGEKWRDGLFTGNGTVGANVYGGSVDERVLINHVNNKWLGRINVVPDISLKLKTIRKMLDASDNMNAQDVLSGALSSKRFAPHQEYPLPIGELIVTMSHSGAITDFDRELDMSTGEISVCCQANGTKYSRRLFASRDNDMIAYTMTKQGAVPISADFTFSTLHPVNCNTKQGVCPMPEVTQCKTDKDCLYYTGRNDSDGTDFGVVVRFVAVGGIVKSDGEVMHVSNCTSLTLLIKTFTGANHTKEWTALAKQLLACRDSYDKMLKAHTSIHNKLFKSVDMQLTNADHSIESMLHSANRGIMRPELIEKLYKLGRYLMLSATGGHGQLFSPSGLWNGSYRSYRSEVNFAGEMQMSYMHALQGNMMSDIESTFEMHERNKPDYQNNAIRLFGCNGVLVPALVASNTGRLGSNDNFVLHYTGAGAWLCNYYFAYASASGNTKFLKSRLLPFAKDVATFYSDFVIIKDNRATISPSPLPLRIGEAERITDRPTVGKDSTLDFAVLRHFITNLIQASQATNSFSKEISAWQQLLTQLPQPELSSDSIFKEFVSDNISVDYSGISVGTLYPAYFSKEIDFTSTIEVLENYERTADKKMAEGASQNSLYMAVLASVYARLGATDKAMQCLNSCVRACSMSNLVFVDKDWRGMGICGSGTWAPVQMHTNMMVSNAIQQMLLYSNGNNISVLHCVPKSWDSINVTNMLTDNGVAVSIAHNNAKGILTIKLTSKKNGAVNLFLPSTAKKLDRKSNYQLVKQYGKLCIQDVALVANKTTTVEVRYSL